MGKLIHRKGQFNPLDVEPRLLMAGVLHPRIQDERLQRWCLIQQPLTGLFDGIQIGKVRLNKGQLSVPSSETFESVIGITTNRYHPVSIPQQSLGCGITDPTGGASD